MVFVIAMLKFLPVSEVFIHTTVLWEHCCYPIMEQGSQDMGPSGSRQRQANIWLSLIAVTFIHLIRTKCPHLKSYLCSAWEAMEKNSTQLSLPLCYSTIAGTLLFYKERTWWNSILTKMLLSLKYKYCGPLLLCKWFFRDESGVVLR